ncbi:MAG: twin-arginine translocation signal domain-containing protein, partial [Candidatus Binatia bacterium]
MSGGLQTAVADARRDHVLGLDADITRRDFLNGCLLAGGAWAANVAPGELLQSTPEPGAMSWGGNSDDV